MPSNFDPTSLSTRSQMAIFELKRALREERKFKGIQITFDEVECMDYPPQVEVKVIPEVVDAE